MAMTAPPDSPSGVLSCTSIIIRPSWLWSLTIPPSDRTNALGVTPGFRRRHHRPFAHLTVGRVYSPVAGHGMLALEKEGGASHARHHRHTVTPKMGNSHDDCIKLRHRTRFFVGPSISGQARGNSRAPPTYGGYHHYLVIDTWKNYQFFIDMVSQQWPESRCVAHPDSRSPSSGSASPNDHSGRRTRFGGWFSPSHAAGRARTSTGSNVASVSKADRAAILASAPIWAPNQPPSTERGEPRSMFDSPVLGQGQTGRSDATSSAHPRLTLSARSRPELRAARYIDSDTQRPDPTRRRWTSRDTTTVDNDTWS